MKHTILSLISKCESNQWIKGLVFPLMASAPVTILGAAKYYPKLNKYLDDHKSLLGVLLCWPLLVLCATYLYRNQLIRSRPTASELFVFLRILANIVGKKVTRFGEHLQRCSRKSQLDAKSTFLKITQPDIQIAEIVQGIWQYFDSVGRSDKVEIRVALARMGREHITRFEFFHPSNRSARSSVEQLQSHNSGYSTAKREREMVIVEDYRAESKLGESARFVVTRRELQEEEGSMLCYPVIEQISREVPFVISVCASKAKHFNESGRNVYDMILEHFSQRIVLEYCLKKLREKSEKQTGN